MKTIIFLIILMVSASFGETPSEPSGIELHLLGAKIKVTDMEKAEDFYGDKMGYRIRSKNPDLIIMEDAEMMLVLEKTQRLRRTNYPEETQTVLVFQANDLNQTTSDLKKKGVSFFYDTPTKVGVGAANKFSDPFGNMHSLLAQTIISTPVFEEPKIYNIGYYIPDIEKGRQFYSVMLGLPVRTLSYYPPALPLNDVDGNFCTILHENKELSPVDVDYPNDTQVLVMYKTPDLKQVVEYLELQKIDVLAGPEENDLGKFIALKDPFGNVLEIYEQE